MSKNKRKTRGARLRLALSNMRFNIIAFIVLVALALVGMAVIRSSLVQNSWETGMTLAQNYASDEQSSLTVYETLLPFGTASIDMRISEGQSREEILDWLNVYFERLNTVLGEGLVDPYLVIDGEIVAANPWEGDETYDVYSTEWYQKAIAAEGEVIFTDLYIDAISAKPVITAAQKCKQSDAVMAFDILPENKRFEFDSVSLSAHDSFFLCDSTGNIIYKETSLDASDDVLREYVVSLLAGVRSGTFDSPGSKTSDLDGKDRAVYYARMENGWYSIVTALYSDILADYNLLVMSFALSILLFFAVLAGMTWREMKINSRIERTNETVRVLGNSYFALYRIDYGKDTYEMIKGSNYVRDRLPPSGPYGDLLRTAGEVIEENAFKEFQQSFSSENIRRLVSHRVRDFGGDFLRRFGEEMRWVSVRVLFDESLAPEEVVLCFREVEEEKQRQLRQRRLLEDALAVARQNEAAKQRFFSNMSHDMRTPLNAIIGLSELADKNLGDPQRVHQYLEKINFSSRQLLGLINDILDMSRMEHGGVVLNETSFDLRTFMRESTEAFRIQADAEHKDFALEMNIRNAQIVADPFRVGQIFNNLLSNAFKFTSEGDKIRLSVEQLGAVEGEYEKFKFIVSDTGIGMSNEFLPHLFEPYSREMRFSEKQIAGTGLGMPIIRSLVAQMNGEIQVESELGKGSVFTVVLPFALAREADAAARAEASKAPEKEEGAASPLEGMRVLLAEDNEVNMEITTELLSMNGAGVVQAWNGSEALEAFKASEPGYFDAILMDMQMPVMDGCESARRIRALPRKDAKTVPIIAVTANAFAEDIVATTAAGMNAHISKPIDFATLAKTLGALAKGSEKPSEGVEG